MKLKSLLLGSAAALALTTAAQAADPIGIGSFAALDVCDAYGISGVTISTDDTCVALSGRVRYRYDQESVSDVFRYRSRVDWNLDIEISTQTDAGLARAFFTLEQADIDGWRVPGTPFTATTSDVAFDQAYVSFGDTTVLSAGKMDSLFNIRDDADFFDWGVDLRDIGGNFPDEGTHSIAISSIIADGFTVTAALENLEGNADTGGGGTAGLAVGYTGSGINVSAGVLLGDLYADADDVLVFLDADVTLDNLFVSGSIGFGSNDDLLGLIYGRYDFDMFTIAAQVAGNDDDEYGVGLSVGFDITETVGVTVLAEYWDGLELPTASATVVGVDERFEISATADFTLAENLTASAGVGYRTQELTAGGTEENVFGTAGVVYAPGGGFRTSLGGKAFDNGDYEVNFAAQKSF